MSLVLYNSLTRKKEALAAYAPDGRLGMYVCGPTVYDDSHIGHARSAFVFEVMRRYLEFRNYNVVFVRNVTDVDDKIIEQARKEKEPLKTAVRSVSERYLALYREEMGKLGISAPTEEPKATEYIQAMQKMIQEILKNGAGYVSGKDVYFEVKRAKNYGRLSRRNPDQMLEGTREEPAENKKDPLDFALWKGAKPEEPSWESPWGQGRPGWHIECSTMSTEIFRERNVPFVIHGGGLDLLFPHHENEIAQAQGAGRPFAPFWAHHGLVTVEGRKMSKSLGNTIPLRDLFKKVSPEVIRFYFLQTHYRSPLDFSWKKLDEAKASHKRFLIFLGRVRALQREEAKRKETEGKPLEKLSDVKEGMDTGKTAFDDFLSAMDDDLNTPEAIAILFRLLNFANKVLDDPNRSEDEKVPHVHAARVDLIRLGGILGLSFALEDQITPEEEALIQRRQKARKQGDFKTADAIRRQLLEQGLILEDTAGGVIWRRK